MKTRRIFGNFEFLRITCWNIETSEWFPKCRSFFWKYQHFFEIPNFFQKICLFHKTSFLKFQSFLKFLNIFWKRELFLNYKQFLKSLKKIQTLGKTEKKTSNCREKQPKKFGRENNRTKKKQQHRMLVKPEEQELLNGPAQIRASLAKRRLFDASNWVFVAREVICIARCEQYIHVPHIAALLGQPMKIVLRCCHSESLLPGPPNVQVAQSRDGPACVLLKRRRKNLLLCTTLCLALRCLYVYVRAPPLTI